MEIMNECNELSKGIIYLRFKTHMEFGDAIEMVVANTFFKKREAE